MFVLILTEISYLVVVEKVEKVKLSILSQLRITQRFIKFMKNILTQLEFPMYEFIKNGNHILSGC